MNGVLFNNDHGLYYRCLNRYKVTFKDGTVRYTKAKCKFDAEENVCWFGDEDKTDEIISCEEIEE